MAAALDVNWEAIKMLALEVGVREAARQMGLLEDTVKRRCTREGWIVNLPRSQSLPATVVRHVPNVPSPANLLAEAMRNDSTDCRATALRVAKRALKRVERCDDDELMLPEVASVLGQHTKTAATAGAWQTSSPTLKIQLGAVGSEPMTMEAEVVEEASKDVADY